MRWYASDNKLKYPFKLFSLIDLIAILPSILMLSANLTALRFFRIFRMLRVLKITRYINFYIWFKTHGQKAHIKAIIIKITLVFVLWISGSFILLITENSKGFDNFKDSLWNVVIMTMSGLDGDVPSSNWGRFETALLMFIGILIISFITGEIISVIMEKTQQKGKIELLPDNIKLVNHIIIINKNKQLYNIIKQIYGAYEGKHYIIIVSEDIKTFDIPDKKLSKKVLGLNANILEKDNLKLLSIEESLGIIILSPEENEKKGVISAISVINRIREIKEQERNLNKNFKLVIEVKNENRYKDYQNILPRLNEIKKIYSYFIARIL